MDTPPPPTKPPRGVKYGKEEAGCGFLVNVIKSLGFSETNEERQKEKHRIENEFKKSDQRLNELVSKHDTNMTRVLPLFSQLSTDITASREKVHSTKEKLIACKQLLQCRRDELKKLWTDAVQHKFVLEMLNQITELHKVPHKAAVYSTKKQYLHAAKVLCDASKVCDGPLRDVEGLSDFRNDLQTRKNHLYQKLHEEIIHQLYKHSPREVLLNFQRLNAEQSSASNFTRNFTRRSTDRMEANARVQKALVDMAQGFDFEKSETIEDTDLIDADLSVIYYISIAVECFGMLDRVSDSIEKIRVQIQSHLLDVVRNTTNQMIDLNLKRTDRHTLLALLGVLFKQFKSIARMHTLLLKNYLSVISKYSVVATPYDLSEFWAQAQSVLQLLLTDYLDIQNEPTEKDSQVNFNEPSVNVNSYFIRRKFQSNKRTLFKFDKSSDIVQNESNQQSGSFKEHRRNNPSNVENLGIMFGGARAERHEKVGLCEVDQAVITKIYLPLMGYIQEIEVFMKCKSGEPCSLHEFIDNYVKETFLGKGHFKNLHLTIESLSKNQDAWRAIVMPENVKSLNIPRPLLQSTVIVERKLSETKSLIQDLPCFSEDLLKMVCSLLKTYRETCQAAYRSIVQPDSEDKRIYSVTWLKDEDISRFLKTLPNWTDLKTSKHHAKQQHSMNLHRGQFEPSEEESPVQVQERNVREAEMLTSNLRESGITQQEILSDISVLKELAIMQESMEWFAFRVSEFANELRRPIISGHNLTKFSSIAIKDGTIKVLTNLAMEFDELANTCLLVLHLEVRVQCFYYLRSRPTLKPDYVTSKDDDILEPDRQVQKLTKILTEMDEAFSSTLHPSKTRYIFEGLAHLTAKILIQASHYFNTIDQIIIQQMCRNSLALQHTLSNITASREVALDQAKYFYELLCMEPNDILTSIIERGPQFSEMQYLNALQLSCKARNIADSNTLGVFQQKLYDILGANVPSGIIV